MDLKSHLFKKKIKPLLDKILEAQDLQKKMKLQPIITKIKKNDKT